MRLTILLSLPGARMFIVKGDGVMSSEIRLQEMEITTESDQKIHLAYEETGDVLEIVFDDIEATCAVELTDNILLRFHREQGRAAGLTFLGPGLPVRTWSSQFRSHRPGQSARRPTRDCSADYHHLTC